MALHIKREITKAEVPVELIRLAFAHLESAEKLNSMMNDGSWASGFYKGRVVQWLTFHATEVFLKGCVLHGDPKGRITGHSLAQLTKRLKSLFPDIEFRPPFEKKALVPYPGLIAEAEKLEKQIHERLRYPIDTTATPWSGVHGFDSETFSYTLQKVRADFERIATVLFVDPPANPTVERDARKSSARPSP
jgi:hypothetical protein